LFLKKKAKTGGQMMTILDYLRKVPDSRRGQGQKYKIEHILLFSILAILSGANDYEAITVFIEQKFWELTEIFNLKWVRAPTSNTIRNIFHKINTEDIEKAFREYAESIKKEDFKPYIAIDGKRLKGSYDHSNNLQALHILNIYAT